MGAVLTNDLRTPIYNAADFTGSYGKDAALDAHRNFLNSAGRLKRHQKPHGTAIENNQPPAFPAAKPAGGKQA